MKFLTSCLLIVVYLVANTCLAVTIAELKPIHPRPFLLPDSEKQKILSLIETKSWANQEFINLQEKATNGNGYSAAFLYALTDRSEYLKIAKNWLIDIAKAGGDIGGRALNIKKDFFKTGMPWLGDVFYRTNSDYLEAFDFIYKGLNDSEKKIILKGINASADFRLKAMDAWWQTPNLVFKPTSMVAIAGLITQNSRLMDWGFFRKPESNLGGYFSTLDTMLRDNGPWYEAPIYAISHLPLNQSLKVSDYLNQFTGSNWFNKRLKHGSSVKGLMDYYIGTTYPGELRSDGKRDFRVLTYGDGATGQGGDFYLVNHNPKQRNLETELALAYKLSRDPSYAAFLKQSSDYKPDLFNQPELPVSPLLPTAPSSIWPDFGLAFLRSDHSRNYWTNPDAIAVSLLFRQGYGHGHADALAITLFGGGQLFYPDYNAIQYENPAVGWTASSVAHNTVVVDGNDSQKPKHVEFRHEFNDDLRFVQTKVEEPLGIAKQRTLVLASDYLLDVFHLGSLIPRTYDYLLHSFGRIETDKSNDYQNSKPFSTRYKNIKNFTATRQDHAWSLDFVIDANRKKQNLDRIINQLKGHNDSTELLEQAFDYHDTHRFKAAKLALTMAAHPNTLIGVGEDEYGLSFLAARRENLKQTAFISLHSPYYADQQDSIDHEIQTMTQTSKGSLVKVSTNEYIDFHAISHQDGITNLYDDRTGTGVKFKDYALIRIKRNTGKPTNHGQLESYFLSAKSTGFKHDLTLSDYQPGQAISISQSPVQINVSPDLLVLKNFSDSSFVISLTNKTEKLLSARIILPETDGFDIPRKEYQVGLIPAYQTAHQQITLGRYGQTAAVDVLPIDISLNNSEDKLIRHGLKFSKGPALIRQYEKGLEPVYQIHTFDSVFDFTMRHGFVTAVTDEDKRSVFKNSTLFNVSDGNTTFSPQTGNIQTSYTWANENNSSLITKINDSIRWHILVIQNRFYLKLDETYTRVQQVFFVFDKNNKQFDWKNAAYLEQDQRARLATTKDPTLITRAAEIPFVNSELSLCIKTQTTKNWINDVDQLAFSLQRVNNDQFVFGLCNQGTLTSWAQ